jgi:HAD superfamily hydrolase (TIGR01549 family)
MPSTQSIEAVIFDIDGTLVDSNDLHVDAWRVAFRRYGKDLTRAEIHAQIGKGGDQLIPVFLTREELARFGEALERYRVELFIRDYLPRAEPFPRVRALFERIREDGMRIALASSAKKTELEHHLKKLGVEDLIEASTSADDAEHSKPCPDIFEAALERVQCRADAALVIGDSPYDIQAASKAGMRTIAFLSGGFSEEQLRAEGATAVYRDAADLLQRYDESPLRQPVMFEPS